MLLTSPEATSQAVPSGETDERLLDLLAGYRRTQLLYVAAQLGLANLLADGPKSSGELAHALIELVMPERAEQAPAATESDVNMLVMTGGQERTEAEHRRLLASAELELRRILPTSGRWSLIGAAPA